MAAYQRRIVGSATETGKASTSALARSSSLSVTVGKPDRWRTIIVVVDQFNLAALHATINPSSSGALIKGATTSSGAPDRNDSAATSSTYSCLAAKPLTLRSLSPPFRLSPTILVRAAE